MSIRLLLVFVSLMLVIDGDTLVAGAKKAKKKKPIEHPEVSSYKRPDDITPTLYCESCNAILD